MVLELVGSGKEWGMSEAMRGRSNSAVRVDSMVSRWFRPGNNVIDIISNLEMGVINTLFSRWAGAAVGAGVENARVS